MLDKDGSPIGSAVTNMLQIYQEEKEEDEDEEE
jgi:hypothetical protein